MHSGERWTNVVHDIKAVFHKEQNRIPCEQHREANMFRIVDNPVVGTSLLTKL